MDKRILKLLYRSFDDPLSPDEQEQLNAALESSEELKNEKEQIMAARKVFQKSWKPKFEPFFADRVMAQIRNSKTVTTETVDEFVSALVLSFRKIAIAGTIAAILLLTNNFIAAGGISLDKSIALQQISIEDSWSFNRLIMETIK